MSQIKVFRLKHMQRKYKRIQKNSSYEVILKCVVRRRKLPPLQRLSRAIVGGSGLVAYVCVCWL